MWADKNKKIPTKIECLTEASMLIKTLYFKDIKDFGGGIVRPSALETDSPLYKDYKSIMLFANIKQRDLQGRGLYPHLYAQDGFLEKIGTSPEENRDLRNSGGCI